MATFYPQFFHTLVPSFLTHFMIPEDFFLKYIEGTSFAELKSDVSDRTWKVKMSDRRITDGWEDFVVANDFRIGDVVVFRYVGDLVFHVSNLGPNYSEIQDNEGKHLLRKRLHQVDFSSNNGDVCDNEEVPREKKAKTNSGEAEAVSSSSSADNSCFVALITALNLTIDTLYLPLHFTSSNGLTRKNSEIVLTDGGERSWVLDLRFDESSHTFYISRGWRNFCDENGQKAGDFFMFKLVGNGEKLVLSFRPTESINDGRQIYCSEASRKESVATKLNSEEENIAREDSKDECSSLDSLMDIEKKKYSAKRRGSPYSSYSPSHKQFVTFTLPPDYARIGRLSLSAPFVRENGINKPGEICLLDKHGRKWLTNLLLDSKGTMSLGKGWKDFVKANSLETGFTLKLKWEETTPVLSLCYAESNSDREQEEFSKAIEKRSLFMDTKVDFSSNNGDVDHDDEDDIEHPREKKAKMNSLEEEAGSSLSDKSCFVALVTASNLRTDTLYLPPHFTSSNGLTRKCHKIVLRDGGERSWELDLKFNESSDTFYISQGWRNFCDENGQKAGGFFMFKLVGNGETLVLSFRPTKSINDGRQRYCSEASRRESVATKLSSEEENITWEGSKDECSTLESLMEKEKKKYSLKPRGSPHSSYSPCHKRFVTFTLPPDYARIGRLSLPAPFVRENGINKPGEIFLLDKYGRRWLTNLLLDSKGTMFLGKGWKDFVKANSLETVFMLKLIWEETTPVLSLCCVASNSDTEQEDFSKAIEKQSHFIDTSNRDKINNNENNKDESRSWERKKNHPKWRDSTPSTQKQYVTLTITPFSVKKNILRLSKIFTRENDINKPGKITLLGKDGIKQQTNLLFDKTNGSMSLGSGWKDFVKDNGLKTGDSFTLKLIWEDQTPVLSLCPAECSIDREAGGTNQKKSLPIEPSICTKVSKDVNIKEKNNKEESRSVDRERNHLRETDVTPSSQKHVVTLTITPSSVKRDRLILSAQFARENNINKPGTIYLLDRDGTKSLINLQQDKRGTMSLGKGWKEFAEANDIKLGESFMMKLVWEGTIPMLSLLRTEFSSSKANKKESISSEPKSRDSSPIIKNRFVTPALTPEDVKSCKLIPPTQFMKENNKEESMSVVRKRNRLRGKDLTPSSQKQFVTFTITPSCVGKNRLILTAQFARENNINKPGTLYLLDRDGTKWLTTVKRDNKGTMSLGNGWKEFAETNDLKLGDSFRMELIWEDTTPILSLLRTKFSSSKSNKEESISSEPKSRDSSQTIENRFVTLALTPEDVKACKLILPSQFMKANGISNKLGKITLLGENKVEWPGYLLSRDGTVALGNGWEGFCEANGVKLGHSFTLEFVNEQDTTPVLKFSSPETIYKHVN
ncbi:unnamed protein product [Arabidopsis lyrata]|uniref:B3 domain-containing protein REM13 isoform X1 n=1 Tax=Arabidopsis lyrata subsp. lyrata TaxID=81972 RepID=UPI000A29B042|nr:B3 domain-containing protein REM13 isoform X1 [Arabidopsis lyrata subsp. lyrata]CAH8263402.1 unnamed protein product [Arabidopsis lyrata]|eukprot:XP_020885753.1 B3 domain-containing protein REM13 isoform X1 [Arabidopsis lyrata subsp. lyrata]